MCLVTLHGPADDVRIVKIVMLGAVYVRRAKIHHQVDLFVERGTALRRYTVIVAIEYTGISLWTEQDHCVGKRNEPGLDRALKGLSGLCVVIVDESDRMCGIGRYQGVLEELLHVEFTAAVAGLEEVEVERNVEEGHASSAVMEILPQDVDFRIPIFAHGEKLLVVVGAEFSEPFGEKFPRDVLDGVQTETVHICGVEVPLSPVCQLLAHLGHAEVYIGAHQIVVVDIFAVYAAVPLHALELVDCRLIFDLVVVYAVEACVVPDKIGIPAAASGECKFGPSLDRLGIGDRFRSILFAYSYSLDRLRLVSAHAVVENNVRIDIDTASL